MSLRVWLPLNGDLENKGLDEIIFTSTIVSGYEAGKIGQAIKLLGTNIVFTAPSLEGVTKFSIAFWFKSKSNSSITTNWNNVIAINSSNADETVTAEWRFESSYINSYILSAHNNFGDPIMFGTGSLVPERDKWYHIVATCDGESLIKFYINGEHINSDRTYLGGHLRSLVKIANQSADPDVLLNDLRIYDHCLSLKQIKEISKGLILHYPLNRQGLGQKNLLPCGGTYTQSSPWTTTLNRADGWAFVTNSGFEATPDKTYTISVECDGNLYSSHGGTHNPDDKHWTFWAYLSNIDTTKNWQNGGYDTPVNLTSRNNNYRKIGNTHVWTITLNSSQKYIGLRTNSYSDGNTDLTIHWWNMKIEEGDKFTGWSPNSIDSTIEYDCSGYCNNGAKMGTFEYTSDTPKYNISTVYTGSNYIYLNSPSTSEIRTLSLWVNWETISSGQSVIFLDYASKIGLGLMSTGILCGTSGPGNYKTFSKTNLTANTWYHFVVINPDEEIGLNRKLYINGVEQSPTSSVSNWSYNVNQIQIGKRSSTSDGFIGKLSDLRLYSTILSEADIKELYQTSALIDRNQNLYVREVIE